MTRKKLVATANRRDGVYNRTGKPSVTFCERGGARKRADVFLAKKNGAKQALLRRGGDGGGYPPDGQGVEGQPAGDVPQEAFRGGVSCNSFVSNCNGFVYIR